MITPEKASRYINRTFIDYTTCPKLSPAAQISIIKNIDLVLLVGTRAM